MSVLVLTATVRCSILPPPAAVFHLYYESSGFSFEKCCNSPPWRSLFCCLLLQPSQEKWRLRGELELVCLQESILLEFYFSYWFFTVSFNPEMNTSKKLLKPQRNNNRTPKNQTKTEQKQICESFAGWTSSSACFFRGKKKYFSFRPILCLSLVPKERITLRRVKNSSRAQGYERGLQSRITCLVMNSFERRTPPQMKKRLKE